MLLCFAVFNFFLVLGESGEHETLTLRTPSRCAWFAYCRRALFIGFVPFLPSDALADLLSLAVSHCPQPSVRLDIFNVRSILTIHQHLKWINHFLVLKHNSKWPALASSSSNKVCLCASRQYFVAFKADRLQMIVAKKYAHYIFAVSLLGPVIMIGSNFEIEWRTQTNKPPHSNDCTKFNNIYIENSTFTVIIKLLHHWKPQYKWYVYTILLTAHFLYFFAHHFRSRPLFRFSHRR